MPRIGVKVQRRGGQKLRKVLREIGKGGISEIRVGFFSTARYPDEEPKSGRGKKRKGPPVAAVAAWNEFGTKAIPERPFFRRALAEAEDGIVDQLKDGIDPEKMTVDPLLADKIGIYVQAEIQESITALRKPPNAPETIRQKGSANPLIDTGFMLRSVTYEVKR